MSTEKDITTTEFGYYLISELITMKDRILAQKIELDIWANSPTPRPSRLAAYISALKESGDGSEFYVEAEKIAAKSELIFTVTPEGTVIANVPS